VSVTPGPYCFSASAEDAVITSANKPIDRSCLRRLIFTIFLKAPRLGAIGFLAAKEQRNYLYDI
jgi:hypothetical protein